MILKGCVLAGLAVVVSLGAPADIYQWTYDQLPLGPGWTAHIFANRTGDEVIGLELLPAKEGPVQILVVGGNLVLAPEAPGLLPFSGRVIPGGVVIVALPEGIALHGAAWVTVEGRVPVEVDLPIPRLDAQEIRPIVLVLATDLGTGDEHWTHWHRRDPDSGVPIGPPGMGRDPGANPVQGLVFEYLFLWPADLDPEALRIWEGYPYLVRLDARRSFSPVGKEIVAWRWTWEDGLVQEGPVVVRGFDRPGIYRVCLMVTDSAGRIQTFTRFVTAADWEVDLTDWFDNGDR